MIQINLLPEELRKKEVARVNLPELPVKKALFAGVLGILVLQLLGTFGAIALAVHNAQGGREIARLTQTTQEIQDLSKQSTTLQSNVREFETLSKRPYRWATLLHALTQSMTKGVWLRVLQVDETVVESSRRAPASDEAKSEKASSKRPAKASRAVVKVLKLEGSVMAPGQEASFVGKFLKSLKDNPDFSRIFSDVQLSSMSQRRIKDYDVYDFVITCTFRRERAA